MSGTYLRRSTFASASTPYFQPEGTVDGVNSVTAGTGISLTGTASAPIVNNAGVLSVSAGTGITVGGTASAPSIANSGVLSVSAGTGVTLGGTASAPVVNATPFASGTTTVVSFPLGAPLTASNTGGATTAVIPGSSVNVTPGEWLMINVEYSISSTAISSKTMSLFGQFQNIGNLLTLYSTAENTTGIGGSTTFVVQVPAGTVPTFQLLVGGEAGSGTITAFINSLSYSKLNL